MIIVQIYRTIKISYVSSWLDSRKRKRGQSETQSAIYMNIKKGVRFCVGKNSYFIMLYRSREGRGGRSMRGNVGCRLKGKPFSHLRSMGILSLEALHLRQFALQHIEGLTCP